MYCPDGSGTVRTMPATEQRVSLPPRYRVLRHIADGGMASVWAAEDELLGRLVAVKVLSPVLAGDADARRRFDPNLQKVRVLVGKAPKRVYVCTRCLKAGKVTKAV